MVFSLFSLNESKLDKPIRADLRETSSQSSIFEAAPQFLRDGLINPPNFVNTKHEWDEAVKAVED